LPGNAAQESGLPIGIFSDHLTMPIFVEAIDHHPIEGGEKTERPGQDGANLLERVRPPQLSQ
jgi:hypothetical protein